MLLLDTSAWVEFLRRDGKFDLEAELEFDEVVTCLPVVREVLQGFGDERAYRQAREAMLSLPMVESPLEEALFVEAADLFRAARRAGFTVRSGVDCLIAACGLRHALPVVHFDRDFDALARVSALESRNLRSG